MKKVILITSVMYSGSFYPAGETLEINDQEAKKWIAQRIARPLSDASTVSGTAAEGEREGKTDLPLNQKEQKSGGEENANLQ